MERMQDDPEKIVGKKEPRLHPNDTTHNVENLDEIMESLRKEAKALNIQDYENLDRNELYALVEKARTYEMRKGQPAN